MSPAYKLATCLLAADIPVADILANYNTTVNFVLSHCKNCKVRKDYQ